NPSTIWAGSASGGLWRSTTAGLGATAWARVPLAFGAMSVSTLALHPTDSLTLYVGTGEVYRYGDTQGGVTYRPTRGGYGVGVLKTVDGGATWTHALNWSRNQERGVQMLRLDPSNPNTLWAATTEGVLVSRDAGATWTTSLSVLLATDVTVNPANPNEVVAACGNQLSTGFGIYRTVDGGANWTRITTGVPSSYVGKVVFDRHPTQPATLFASVGNGIEGTTSTWLLRSTNGGATWTTVTTTDYGSYQGWYSHFVAVNPHRPDDVLLAGVEMWHSSTGGTNPVQQTSYAGLPFEPPIGGPDGPPEYMHPDHHHFAFHPTNPDLVYFANDGGIFRSLDGGLTYESINGGLQTTQFYNGTAASVQDSTLMMGGLQDNGVVMWSGGGVWRRPIGGDGTYTAIDPRTPERVYGASQYLNMLRSENGGQSFTGVRPTGNAGFVAPYAIAPSLPDRLYAAGRVVYRSENRGTNWTATNGNLPVDPAGNLALALTVAPSDANTVYVTTSPNLRAPTDTPGPPRLFVTVSAGASWIDRTAGLPSRFLTDVAIHPTDPQTAYVTASGFGTGHVFRTTDGGVTWTDLTNGLPDIPTSAVALDPLAPDQIYVGTDVGVFVSRNGGASWAAFTEGLPEAVMVIDLVISAPDRTLRAATHGNGVYLRRLERNPVAAEPGADGAAPTLVARGPNPFRDATTVEVQLAAAADVGLDLYDAAGRRVAVWPATQRPAGRYPVVIDGRGLAPGTYTVRLTAGETRATLRVTRIR
ncbi:MAG TPA: FlgD immunoglobulin-like domain containing protein, partial [Rhodothermales bacterium]|nr:FlgD immunoglobulin-like domain containing protein [Rhodothermales bacterium]